MKDTTIDYLIKLLKKDSVIKQKNFSSEDINQEIIDKLKIKITRKYKTMRWIIAATLILVLASFIYLSKIEDNYTKLGEHIISFWYIFLGVFIVNIFVSKEIWNSKRNLLILDLFEKEHM
jgi:hypothetical protein